MEKYLILHDIRSAHNVGSIFRTADGAGVVKIFLTGYTPAPIDRFGRVQPEIKKTALGATETILWESVPEIDGLISKLKNEGIDVIAVEQTATSIDHKTFALRRDTAFVFGNEVEGLPAAVCETVDAVVEIPMVGAKESLNVSVAVGIILFNTQAHRPPDHFHQ